MGKIYQILLTSLALCATQACQKPPIYDNVPQITFNGFSRDTIQQNEQAVTFFIGFTDGDGDIGSNGAEHNLILIDERREDTTFYRMPPIPRRGVAGGISGEIEVNLAQICCIHPDFPIICTPIENTYDAVIYRIRIRDNANNWSNEIKTQALMVRCF